MIKTEVITRESPFGLTKIFNYQVTIELLKASIDYSFISDLSARVAEDISKELAPRILDDLMADPKFTKKMVGEVRMLIAKELVEKKLKNVQK